MKHLRPRSIAAPDVVRSEGNIRSRPDASDCVRVFPRSISFISGDFGDLKILRSRIDQSRKHFNVARKSAANLNGSHDIRFDSAHQMALDPIVLLFNRAVFVVKPTGKTASREARRIGSEIGLYRFERQAALSNQGAENGGQIGILKIVGNAVEVRNFGNESASVCFPQITHKTTLRNSGINFKYDIENSIRQGQWRPASFGWGCNETGTEISKQDLEFVLFMGLRLVVSGPVLRIRGAFLFP